MLDDLLALTTTLVHSDHEHELSAASGSETDIMAPRSRHTKSASVASSTDADTTVKGTDLINGGMLPPATTPDHTTTRTSKRRPSRSTTSPPSSPVVVIPATRKVVIQPEVHKDFEVVKFVGTVILSTLLEAGLQTAASMVGTGDYAAISKRADTWPEILGLLAWKIAKLGIYWAADFDAYDVASMTLLLSTPQSILLGLFYDIHPTTLASTTLSSILANSLPYLLLRPLSPSHNPNAAPKAILRNRPILTDPYTTVATSLLATAIFAVLLEASFATFLPSWLITHFTGLRTLEKAHLGAGGLPILLLALIPAGVAAMEYLFAPSTAVASTAPSAPTFDPSTASFAEHVYHNGWGWYSPRQKALISRAGLLAYLIVVETVVLLWGTLEGVEFTGAIGYAGIWGAGVVLVAAALDWVGGPSD
ncbi:hypothetical protein PV05_11656 [Exophiala xenobiotica]|uniref:Uncharacterized protein n=1 Tax=Exophiala xenobiotica TaxID=348802 RepID=A0A0D2CJQ1_9EURO|nr:uncharacterized protein PV05_11656 [Exophiala xenobiotica]KIW50032.1 hypothetical protein PV05_11656 [Exophiala xenobiotica]